MTKAKTYYTNQNPTNIDVLEALQIVGTGASFTGIVTATTFVGDLTGTVSNAQGLTGTPDIIVGIITASVYSITGSISDLQGSAGTTTVDSDTTAVHYVTYNTNSTSVNISNFTSGKEFKLFVRNTAGGNRTLVIRTSTTTTGHATVPTLVHFGTATITNGTINAASGTGYLLTLHNINGTIIGNY